MPIVVMTGKGNNRPEVALPGRNANGENAAIVTLHAQQSVLTLSVIVHQVVMSELLPTSYHSFVDDLV